MDSHQLKDSIRQECLERRKAMDRDLAMEASAEIFEQWRNRFSLKQVAWFHIFQSMEKFREVDTGFFIQFIRQRHSRIRIVHPVVDPIAGKLRHAWIEDHVEMVRGKFGIMEPRMPYQFVYPAQLDMVMVPMLAFDDKGHRIGFGKGYYDEFLSKLRPACLKIGVCYDEFHLEEPLPAEPHDVPLDYVVTEAKVYRFRGNQEPENHV